MNKIILALMVSSATIHSYAMCTYNFDLTQTQLNQAGSSDKIFPINQGQKIGFNIETGTASYLGLSEKCSWQSRVYDLRVVT